MIGYIKLNCNLYNKNKNMIAFQLLDKHAHWGKDQRGPHQTQFVSWYEEQGDNEQIFSLTEGFYVARRQ